MNVFELIGLDAPPHQNVPYQLKRGRRKSVALRIGTSGELLVSAPYFTSTRWIENFIRQHWRWVQRQQTRLRERAHWTARKRFVTGEIFPMYGIDRTLEVLLGESAIALSDTHLRVTSLDPSPSSVRHRLLSWYRGEAERYVHDHLEGFATRLGVTYRHVRIVEQKSRWGSCSRKRDLRFNWKLIMLPRECADYVLVHELAHVREMNHSPRFWSVVSEIIPDYKSRRQRIRAYAPHTEFSW